VKFTIGRHCHLHALFISTCILLQTFRRFSFSLAVDMSEIHSAFENFILVYLILYKFEMHKNNLIYCILSVLNALQLMNI
jgi:hypothetical protein